jgi:hypothetical protein
MMKAVCCAGSEGRAGRKCPKIFKVGDLIRYDRPNPTRTYTAVVIEDQGNDKYMVTEKSVAVADRKTAHLIQFESNDKVINLCDPDDISNVRVAEGQHPVAGGAGGSVARKLQASNVGVMGLSSGGKERPGAAAGAAAMSVADITDISTQCLRTDPATRLSIQELGVRLNIGTPTGGQIDPSKMTLSDIPKDQSISLAYVGTEPIGTGSSGKVWEVIISVDGSKKGGWFAIKLTTDKEEAHLVENSSVYACADHNVIAATYLGDNTFYPPGSGITGVKCHGILMQLAPYDLKVYISSQGGHMKFKEIYLAASDILNGCVCALNLGQLHCDIKPANSFVIELERGGYRFFLGDIGGFGNTGMIRNDEGQLKAIPIPIDDGIRGCTYPPPETYGEGRMAGWIQVPRPDDAASGMAESREKQEKIIVWGIGILIKSMLGGDTKPHYYEEIEQQAQKNKSPAKLYQVAAERPGRDRAQALALLEMKKGGNRYPQVWV